MNKLIAGEYFTSGRQHFLQHWQAAGNETMQISHADWIFCRLQPTNPGNQRGR